MNERDRDYDHADEIEREVWEALQRARQGQATEDDWKLVEWAAGFSNVDPKTNKAIQAAF